MPDSDPSFEDFPLEPLSPLDMTLDGDEAVGVDDPALENLLPPEALVELDAPVEIPAPLDDSAARLREMQSLLSDEEGDEGASWTSGAEGDDSLHIGESIDSIPPSGPASGAPAGPSSGPAADRDQDMLGDLGFGSEKSILGFHSGDLGTEDDQLLEREIMNLPPLDSGPIGEGTEAGAEDEETEIDLGDADELTDFDDETNGRA